MANFSRKISSTEVKNRFGDYLGEVMHKKEPVLIHRHGKPVAVLEAYTSWLEKEEGKRVEMEIPWIAAADRLFEEIKKDRPKRKHVPAVEMIRQIRDEEGEA